MRAANLAVKPRSIPHVQAAALPLSALTAWQALFEHAHLAAGQAVLITEAPAAWELWQCNWHAELRHLRATRRSYADDVIDYRAARFEEICETWERSRRVLRKGGCW